LLQLAGLSEIFGDIGGVGGSSNVVAAWLWQWLGWLSTAKALAGVEAWRLVPARRRRRRRRGVASGINLAAAAISQPMLYQYPLAIIISGCGFILAA
jgi:hypothetical protein